MEEKAVRFVILRLLAVCFKTSQHGRSLFQSNIESLLVIVAKKHVRSARAAVCSKRENRGSVLGSNAASPSRWRVLRIRFDGTVGSIRCSTFQNPRLISPLLPQVDFRRAAAGETLESSDPAPAS